MRRTAADAAKTRESLLDAALAVFAERGYTAARLEEIAARAEVTRGALHHHFPDKAALYVQAVDARWKEVTAPLWAELDGTAPPLARARRFLVAYLRGAERSERFRLLLEAVTLRTEALPELRAGLTAKAEALAAVADRLTGLFAEARDAGDLRAGVAPRTAALALLSLTTGVTTTWLLSPGLFSPAAAADDLATILLEGLRP
jgi:TetR/AcrR family acrAB operon transcriptional repressor